MDIVTYRTRFASSRSKNLMKYFIMILKSQIHQARDHSRIQIYRCQFSQSNICNVLTQTLGRPISFNTPYPRQQRTQPLFNSILFWFFSMIRLQETVLTSDLSFSKISQRVPGTRPDRSFDLMIKENHKNCANFELKSFSKTSKIMQVLEKSSCYTPKSGLKKIWHPS